MNHRRPCAGGQGRLDRHRAPRLDGRPGTVHRMAEMDGDELRDRKAERRAARKDRAAKGMQVTNRNLKSVQLELDAQRRRNAARGMGPVTDEEVRRLGLGD